MFSRASLGAALAASSLFVLTACSNSSGGSVSFALLPDADADGLPDSLEASIGSDPVDADSPTPAGGD